MLYLEFYRRMRRNPATRRCMSQGDLSAATGVAQKRISEFEKGYEPPTKELQAIARYFGVPEQYADVLTRPVHMAHMPALEKLAEEER